MKKSLTISLVLITAILILINFISGEVRINEVQSKNIEFVEIYNSNNAILNLSEWQIKDNSESDRITCDNIPDCSLITNFSYFIIIGKNSNISNITINKINYFYVEDTKIGSGLNDDGDNVTFFNSEISTNSKYNSSSSGKSWQYCSGNWIERVATPGAENNCTIDTPTTNTTGNTTNTSQNPLIYLEADWTEDEIINGKDFTINVKSYNLENKFYRLRIWIKFEDNDTILSDRYDQENTEWSSGSYYVNEFFRGPGNESGEIKLRIREDYKKFHGDAKLCLKLDGVSDSEKCENIEVLEKKEDSTKTSDSSANIAQETDTTENTPSLTGSVVQLGTKSQSSKTEDIKTSNIFLSKQELIKKYLIYVFAFFCLILSGLLIFNKLK